MVHNIIIYNRKKKKKSTIILKNRSWNSKILEKMGVSCYKKKCKKIQCAIQKNVHARVSIATAGSH